MPNRIIKESICTSEEIEKLSPFQETMFYRLIVNCDDYGRMDARAKIIKSKLYPLKDVRTDQIDVALTALASAELVDLYEVDGKPFLQMRTWDRHQRVRAKVSKYPEPASFCGHLSATRGQMTANADKCVRNPIQSNPNPIQSETDARERAAVPSEKPTKPGNENFDRFWEAYPKKVGKEAARKAFLKVKAPFDKILKAVADQKQSDQWRTENGRFIPNPATWLNQGRWDDVLTTTGYRSESFNADDAFERALAKTRRILEEAGAL